MSESEFFVAVGTSVDILRGGKICADAAVFNSGNIIARPGRWRRLSLTPWALLDLMRFPRNGRVDLYLPVEGNDKYSYSN